jgi:hypothetical protein
MDWEVAVRVTEQERVTGLGGSYQLMVEGWVSQGVVKVMAKKRVEAWGCLGHLHRCHVCTVVRSI